MTYLLSPYSKNDNGGISVQCQPPAYDSQRFCEGLGKGPAHGGDRDQVKGPPCPWTDRDRQTWLKTLPSTTSLIGGNDLQTPSTSLYPILHTDLRVLYTDPLPYILTFTFSKHTKYGGLSLISNWTLLWLCPLHYRSRAMGIFLASVGST